METEKLIRFLKEIQRGVIPAESIIDLADSLVEKLELLTTDKISIPAAGNNSVFIAGDITSHDLVYLGRRYADAENLLKHHGHKALNPLQLIPPGTGWQVAMKICLSALVVNCTSIALFPDWNRSRDAQVQYLMASQLGYNVIKL